MIRILRPAQEIGLDATHFRQRAARARELAQSGDDIRLSRMLLDVAVDLDLEAEAIESAAAGDRRGTKPAAAETEPCKALLHGIGSAEDPRPVQIIDLSAGGARFRVDWPQTNGRRVILEFPRQALRLCGTISDVRGIEAEMVFEPASRANPALGRLVDAGTSKDRIRV